MAKSEISYEELKREYLATHRDQIINNMYLAIPLAIRPGFVGPGQPIIRRLAEIKKVVDLLESGY
jgi:hypothetical protein